MRIGGVRHGRLPFGTKRELLGEDGGCRKMVLWVNKGFEEKAAPSTNFERSFNPPTPQCLHDSIPEVIHIVLALFPQQAHGMPVSQPRTSSARLVSVKELEMQQSLWNSDDPSSVVQGAIDAVQEVGAYECLWMNAGASFKTIADKIAAHPGSRPSDYIPPEEAHKVGHRVVDKLRCSLGGWFDVKIHGEVGYPTKLRDALHPLELLYYQGVWDLVSARSVAVVGTRTPSADGVKRTRSIVKKLVQDGFVIVSGLAKGVDTVAHETALEQGGNAIGVLGTPIHHFYPKSNEALQKEIARSHLLISQVPVERYDSQPNVRANSWFFPERNKTMSAISEATVIIEAGNTSGTLVQAREALRQGRKLFILNSCFERDDLDWPEKFEQAGAIRVRSYDDIRRQLVQ